MGGRRWFGPIFMCDSMMGKSEHDELSGLLWYQVLTQRFHCPDDRLNAQHFSLAVLGGLMKPTATVLQLSSDFW